MGKDLVLEVKKMNYHLIDLSEGTKVINPRIPCEGYVIQLDKEGKNNITIEFQGRKEGKCYPFIREITDVRIAIKTNDFAGTVLHSSIKV